MNIDVLVIGGGPAGIAAAVSASDCGADVLLVEREERVGGILKQCIHDGFGLIRYGERLTGPEYAYREIQRLNKTSVKVKTGTFILSIDRAENGFEVVFVSPQGVGIIKPKSIVLATGCRERTSKQVFIGGTNPAGVITAGTAQHYINLKGLIPGKKCVILGSGDIGLIMARRLTLEGSEVLGVFEAKPSAGGLTRNIVQCLEDFSIPLYLSHTVTRVFGEDRLTAVEVARVDEKMHPIKGTERVIACDTLILSVGLIPENECAKMLHIELDDKTKGAIVDQRLMTSVNDVYACGNALHVNDLVDYVSESGEVAGKCAAEGFMGRNDIPVDIDDSFAYVVPQRLNRNAPLDKTVLYFRVKSEMKNKSVSLRVDGVQRTVKHYAMLKPPEMERWEVNIDDLSRAKKVELIMCDNSIKL